MAIIKPQALDAFLRKDIGSAVGVLIHGSDRGGVRERAKAVAAAVSGRTDDPFAVLKLDDANLAADPGRLADEIQALSLLGGRRVIWIENAGDALAKAIAPFAAVKEAGNLVIAEAGVLPKSSKLRVLFEKASNLRSLACYEDRTIDLHALISDELSSFDVDVDAREALAGLLGADRQMSRQELRKLAIYCHGQRRIELNDIRAIAGDVTGLSSDDLLHAVFGGDASQASRLFHRLVDSGAASSSLLSTAIYYCARLGRMRAEMRRGRSAEAVIASARPPVFFGVKAAIMRELALWDEEALLVAGQILWRATIDSRDYSALQDQVAERAFLSLARSALQLRRAA